MSGGVLSIRANPDLLASARFRWVQCSIDTLNRCVTRNEVRVALNNLPEGLDETYERILLAIDPKTREGQLALRALIWLVAAIRPLRLDELVEGLSINLQTRTLDPDLGPMHSDALLDACGSLVTYTETTGIIILSHFSVKVSSNDWSVHVAVTADDGILTRNDDNFGSISSHGVLLQVYSSLRLSWLALVSEFGERCGDGELRIGYVDLSIMNPRSLALSRYTVKGRHVMLLICLPFAVSIRLHTVEILRHPRNYQAKKNTRVCMH